MLQLQLEGLFAINDAEETPVDGDSFYFTDASDSNNSKRVTGANLRTFLGAPANTDGLAEGTNNLYFTNARALTAAPAETSATILSLIDTMNSNVAVTDVNNLLVLTAQTSGSPSSSATTQIYSQNVNLAADEWINLNVNQTSYNALDWIAVYGGSDETSNPNTDELLNLFPSFKIKRSYSW